MPLVNDLNFNLHLEDYVKASDLLISICEACEISQYNIGFFGEVGFPGVSDIDALIIGSSEKLNKLKSLYDNNIMSSESFRYLFWHPPVFVLESIVAFVNKLHTLEGLKCVKTEVKMFDKLRGNENKLLNIIWFIFLSTVVSNILKASNNDKPISLRLVLLVYNNLMHSNMVFSPVNNELPEHIMPSHDLRELAKRSENAQFNNMILEHFLTLFDYSCKMFDVFCNDQEWYTSATKETALISKNIFYKKSFTTTLNTSRIVNRLHLNKMAFSIVFDYYKGKADSSLLSKYIDNSNICKSKYKSAGLDYPFISPYPLPSSKLENNILRISNSLIQRLLS